MQYAVAVPQGVPDNVSTEVLLPHHLEHLAGSGLTRETIMLAGIRSVTGAGEVKAKLNRSFLPAEVLPAMEFPYVNIETGAPTGKSRFRFDRCTIHNPDYEESVAGHGEAFGPSTDEPERIKFPKYLWPTGSPTTIYAPLQIRPEIRDAKVTLFVTEGEKKALANSVTFASR